MMIVVKKEQLDIVADIDFEAGCDFVDGQCANRRGGANKHRFHTFQCCELCAEKAGYFKVPFDDLAQEYKDLFDPEKGFLGDNGCILPLEKRAPSCALFACVRCKITNEDREKIKKAEQWR